MEGFARKQALVALGMAAGLAFTVAASLWPRLPAVAPELEARIAVWAASSAFAGLWMVLAVALLARHRFFSPQDIDGGGARADSDEAARLQAMLQNTAEQLLLAVIAYGAWLWLGPPARWGLVPVFAMAFGAGRLLFFLGYGGGAAARAPGFTLTFYPTVALYLMLLPAVVRQLL